MASKKIAYVAVWAMMGIATVMFGIPIAYEELTKEPIDIRSNRYDMLNISDSLVILPDGNITVAESQIELPHRP